jgi:hypothetical protein
LKLTEGTPVLEEPEIADYEKTTQHPVVSHQSSS